jgi:hypothetical protein
LSYLHGSLDFYHSFAAVCMAINFLRLIRVEPFRVAFMSINEVYLLERDLKLREIGVAKSGSR